MTHLVKDLGCLLINLMSVKTKLTGVISVYLPLLAQVKSGTGDVVKEMREMLIKNKRMV